MVDHGGLPSIGADAVRAPREPRPMAWRRGGSLGGRFAKNKFGSP